MHRHLLDSYGHLDSPVHRRPAWLKVIAALATVILLVVAPPSLILFASVAIILLVVAAISRIPARFLTKRLILLEPFVLGVAILTLFQPHGGARFLVVATRSTLCLFTLVMLANTTPFSDLLDVLKRARVPGLMVTTLALMFRYLFVLKDESARMRAARASRTFTADRRHTWHAMATVLGQLFVRCGLRADRIYAAMCARGWK